MLWQGDDKMASFKHSWDWMIEHCPKILVSDRDTHFYEQVRQSKKLQSAMAAYRAAETGDEVKS